MTALHDLAGDPGGLAAAAVAGVLQHHATAAIGLPSFITKPMNQPWSLAPGGVLGGAGLAADGVAGDAGVAAGAVLHHTDHHLLQVRGDLRR